MQLSCTIERTVFGMIEVKNLVKSYGKEKALDNVSFTVNKGKYLVFSGQMEQVNPQL